MAKTPKTPNEQSPELEPHDDTNAYLHTEKQHKDWYNRGLMGNLGDKRGYIAQDKAKKPKKRKK